MTGKIIDFEAKRIRDAARDQAWKEAVQLKDDEIRQLRERKDTELQKKDTELQQKDTELRKNRFAIQQLQEQIEQMKQFLTPEQLQQLAQEDPYRAIN